MSGQQARERSRRFAGASAPRHQHPAAAMPDRRRVHQLTAVEFHPPMQNGRATATTRTHTGKFFDEGTQ